MAKKNPTNFSGCFYLLCAIKYPLLKKFDEHNFNLSTWVYKKVDIFFFYFSILYYDVFLFFYLKKIIFIV